MTVKLSFKHKPPKFRRPELLLHPTIPKSLSGVNPRTIRGDEWWNKIRKIVYAENNQCCWACGRHKSEDHFFAWLEAHEWYEYDGETCVATLKEIVGLCHTCHRFIHMGNTQRSYDLGELTYPEVRAILQHGADVLKEAGLGPTYALIALSRNYFDEEKRASLWTDHVPTTVDIFRQELDMRKCAARWKLKLDGEYWWNAGRDLIHHAKAD